MPYTVIQMRGLPSIDNYVAQLSDALATACHDHDLPLPRLVLEPGRSLVARAGVALYAVGDVKRAGATTYVVIDGGLADNPRPALYNARYSALLASRRGGTGHKTVTVAGPYCETGDLLIEGISLPDVQADDLLAVPVSGAYQLSMASNYNAARRPAVVWIDNGEARLIQRRETVDDLLRRDV